MPSPIPSIPSSPPLLLRLRCPFCFLLSLLSPLVVPLPPSHAPWCVESSAHPSLGALPTTKARWTGGTATPKRPPSPPFTKNTRVARESMGHRWPGAREGNVWPQATTGGASEGGGLLLAHAKPTPLSPFCTNRCRPSSPSQRLPLLWHRAFFSVYFACYTHPMATRVPVAPKGSPKFSAKGNLGGRGTWSTCLVGLHCALFIVGLVRKWVGRGATKEGVHASFQRRRGPPRGSSWSKHRFHDEATPSQRAQRLEVLDVDGEAACTHLSGGQSSPFPPLTPSSLTPLVVWRACARRR